MFDFGNSNNGQKEAISSANGPVLITAGPGTGKTYTLVQRAIYLIEECGVQPENLFIATFTEKAAKELITRITNELARRNITANVNEMYVGTFHSLCLRILKENLEYTRLKKNYRLLDAFDQKYTVFQNIYQFRNIPNVDAVLPDSGAWKQSEAICGYVNNLSEELVLPDDLERDADPAISAMGTILRAYQKLLNDNNLMDFSSIQVETYRLLTEHSEILEELQRKITHLMVDEYQDTNYIQEQLVFLLAGKKKNICVVGDDDQGLYRFRGATIRNILEFPQKFNASAGWFLWWLITDPIRILWISTIRGWLLRKAQNLSSNGAHGITTPRMDGTRGSALYAIPFQLSRTPSSEWIKFFLEEWEEPPRFTSMHRPGIASVIGNRIILDGTTIDEVKEFHRDTLKLCVNEANKRELRYIALKQQERERKAQQKAEHMNHVSSVIDEIEY